MKTIGLMGRMGLIGMMSMVLCHCGDDSKPADSKIPDASIVKQKFASEIKRSEAALAAAKEEVEMLRGENLRLETELSSTRALLETAEKRIESARALGRTEAALDALASTATSSAPVYAPRVTRTVPQASASIPKPTLSAVEHPFWKTYQGVGVMKAIRAGAEERWGTDYTMVEFSIKQQRQAYEKLLEYKKSYDRATKGIVSQAEARWGTNYEMVVYHIKEQLEAKSRLDGR